MGKVKCCDAYRLAECGSRFFLLRSTVPDLPSQIRIGYEDLQSVLDDSDLE